MLKSLYRLYMSGRFVILREIFLPAWKLLVVAPFVIVGSAQMVRDEFLAPEYQETYKLLNWLPDWPWEWWALITLALFLILMFEGSYRAIIKRDQTLEQLREKLKPSIQLSKPYIDKGTICGADRSCVCFEVKNIGGQLLKQCLVKLVRIAPLPPGMLDRDLPIGVPTDRQKDKEWTGGFYLRPEEPKHITLMTLASGSPEYPIHLTMGGNQKSLPRENRYTMKMIAYSESAPSEPQEFTVFVDKENMLCIDKERG